MAFVAECRSEGVRPFPQWWDLVVPAVETLRDNYHALAQQVRRLRMFADRLGIGNQCPLQPYEIAEIFQVPLREGAPRFLHTRPHVINLRPFSPDRYR